MVNGPEYWTFAHFQDRFVPPLAARVAASLLEIGVTACEQMNPPAFPPQVLLLLFSEPVVDDQVPPVGFRVKEPEKVSLLPILKLTALMSEYSVALVVLIVSITVQLPLLQTAERLKVEPNPSFTLLTDAESARAGAFPRERAKPSNPRTTHLNRLVISITCAHLRLFPQIITPSYGQH